jgi:hypothetical protein
VRKKVILHADMKPPEYKENPENGPLEDEDKFTSNITMKLHFIARESGIRQVLVASS